MSAAWAFHRCRSERRCAIPGSPATRSKADHANCSPVARNSEPVRPDLVIPTHHEKPFARAGHGIDSDDDLLGTVATVEQDDVSRTRIDDVGRHDIGQCDYIARVGASSVIRRWRRHELRTRSRAARDQDREGKIWQRNGNGWRVSKAAEHCRTPKRGRGFGLRYVLAFGVRRRCVCFKALLDYFFCQRRNQSMNFGSPSLNRMVGL